MKKELKIGNIDNDGNITKEFYGQGEIFKSTKAFYEKAGTCYVPELSDNKYDYNDFLEIAEGNKEIANILFETVDWQSPETLLNDLIDGDEVKFCNKCLKYFLAYGDKETKCNCEEKKVVKAEIYQMKLEDWMSIYKKEYEEGSMWDISFDDLEQFIETAREDNEDATLVYALINNRLYECNSFDDIKEYIV